MQFWIMLLGRQRGTPEAPGRVVTLLRASETETVFGIVYHIAPEHVAEVLDALYYREKAGYSEASVMVKCADGVDREALTFMATEENPHFLGDAPVDAICTQIAVSRGPSGPNVEYLFNLRESLVAHGATDSHVEELFAGVTTALSL